MKLCMNSCMKHETKERGFKNAIASYNWIFSVRKIRPLSTLGDAEMVEVLRKTV